MGVQWLLILSLVVYSQGQSECITGFVDNNTLTEWSQFTVFQVQPFFRQYLFPGIRFRCSGTITKWIVGAGFGGLSLQNRYPALGIYRPRGDDFARVGVTVFEHPEESTSRIYEFIPDPPLPFQTNDRLGIYQPSDDVERVRPFYRLVTDGPTSRNYDPPGDPVEGVEVFNITGTTIDTALIPLVAVEIESDDPDSANCTQDFISQDLLGLLAPDIITPNNQQIVFPSYNFTSDGFITSWTLGALWQDEADRNSFPELQIWRRRNADDNTYDRVDSTELTAAAESPNQLYSETIDPPLQFQSGDVLGMYLPGLFNGTRLLVNFARNAGLTYEIRDTNVPLSTFVFPGTETANGRPFLALEISLIPSPVSTPVTPSLTPSTGQPIIATAVGASVGGVAVAVVTVLIILTVILCTRKKKDSALKDKSVDAIDMTATVTDEPLYDNPFEQEQTNISTKHNEAHTTTIPTAPNAAYGSSTAVPLQSNEAAHHGDTTVNEYDYITI